MWMRNGRMANNWASLVRVALAESKISEENKRDKELVVKENKVSIWRYCFLNNLYKTDIKGIFSAFKASEIVLWGQCFKVLKPLHAVSRFTANTADVFTCTN